jgi:sulfate adenylyltransferase
LRRTIEISQSNKYLINYSNIQTKLLPYILDIKDYKNNLSNGLPLCYPIGLPLFDYDKDKKFKLSKKFIAKYFFLTKKLDYIGIKLFFEKGNFFTFNVKPKKRFLTIINKISDHNLRVKKKIFDLNKKYKKVCAFQTRNIPHSGHEAIIKYLLKSFDHVVINPVIGPKKKEILNFRHLKKCIIN